MSIKRTVITAAGFAVSLGIGAGIGASASANSSHLAARPVPTVTATVPVPGPTAPSVTVTVPGPTVTKTVTAQPPALLSKTFTGTGSWNSTPFKIACSNPLVAVTYNYSDNNDGNFIADIDAPGGAGGGSIANAIGSSGGAATSVYPQTFDDGNEYYLSVTATGSWTVKLRATC